MSDGAKSRAVLVCAIGCIPFAKHGGSATESMPHVSTHALQPDCLSNADSPLPSRDGTGGREESNVISLLTRNVGVELVCPELYHDCQVMIT